MGLGRLEMRGIYLEAVKWWLGLLLLDVGERDF